jgi:basic membrane lipoprotein Med (substrate-binding protein (PBP1-ABC) superfamily)
MIGGERTGATARGVRACVAAALLLASAAAGCGGGAGGGSDDRAAGGPAGEPRAAAEPFRVAVLLTGPVSDDGWNAGAWEGALRIRDELGAEIAKVESLDKSAFEENFRELAARGTRLIFGHAYEFQDAALRVAPDFPRTTFVVIAGNTSSANVGAVHFRLEEATYVLGALAARLSDTRVAGMIGGEEIPSLKPGFDGFVNGARSVDPDFRVVTKYVGNWHDVALGREHAEALIEQGARFLFQNADKAGLGVFQAAAAHPGVYAFGSNKDQNDVVPGAIFASAVLDVPAAYLRVAREVRDGTYVPAAATMGVNEGVVRVAVAPEAAAGLDPETAAFLSGLEARIASGEIDVLASPARR